LAGSLPVESGGGAQDVIEGHQRKGEGECPGNQEQQAAHESSIARRDRVRLIHHLALDEKPDDVKQQGDRSDQPAEAPRGDTASFKVGAAERLLIHAAFPPLP
jgi:hypothetical protein